jgi:hypothetical protein
MKKVLILVNDLEVPQHIFEFVSSLGSRLISPALQIELQR